jgi:aspartate/methionine/tyrosine aminotransferase
LSKAVSFSGLRLGWLIDRDPARRARCLNTRTYFTISHSALLEAAAELVLARAADLVDETAKRAAANLDALGALVARNPELIRWVRPEGGTTAFPWFPALRGTRPFCEALAKAGVLVVPGDCFEMPEHVRIGFGAAPRIGEALGVFERVLHQATRA